MISADEALQRLKDGNARYVQDDIAPTNFGSQARRDELADGQAPFAVVLGCSDSRAPAELIFDQGLGDLFVVRVAGNVVELAVRRLSRDPDLRRSIIAGKIKMVGAVYDMHTGKVSMLNH